MSSVSSADAAPGLVQLAMMRKVMDAAKTQMNGLLSAMPTPQQPPPVSSHAGQLDVFL